MIQRNWAKPAKKAALFAPNAPEPAVIDPKPKARSKKPTTSKYDVFRSRLLKIVAIEVSPPKTNNATERIPAPVTLYYTDPSKNSDKVYRVTVASMARFSNVYEVYAEYGKRGSSLKRVDKLDSATLSDAVEMFETLIHEKKKEGYTTLTSGKPFSR